MTEELDIYVRAYAKPKPESEAKRDNNPTLNDASNTPTRKVRMDRVMVFDTETTADEKQSLIFGYVEIYQDSVLDFCALFYNPNVKEKQLQVLRRFADANEIPLLTRKEFVDLVFYTEVFHRESLCIGFNLPFDISRIASDYGYARGRGMIGGFSFKLSDNMENPRVLVKHISSTEAFIKLGSTLLEHKRGFRGSFVDLRTLGWALRNKKYSLESACEEFRTPIRKKKVNGHGKVTASYINYCITDVKATHSLFNAMLREYEKYGLDLPVNKAYSAAGIGKALLAKMGIKPAPEKTAGIPDSILGKVMSAYHGGRSEIRIRKQPVPVIYMDFRSMYPTVCILMELWKHVICDHIEYQECTEEVVDQLKTITLEDLAEKEIWKKLNVIVEVAPSGDILPVRAKYDGQNLNTGLNHVEDNGKRLWYTIHDVIVSKLLTGKVPKVTRAMRFVPVGIQEGLKPIDFLGGKIDPAKDDFFKALIEYRHELGSKARIEVDDSLRDELDSKQFITKTIANATSYGIYLEINSEDKESEIEVFGLDHFTTITNRTEKLGAMFNPIIGVLITGASRLMLGMAESFVEKRKGYIAFCDTDSIAVNPEIALEAQAFFSKLNPYSFSDDLLKIEDENHNTCKQCRRGKKTKDCKHNEKDAVDPFKQPLLFYGVSAKRYVLYRKCGSKISIIKNSAHGIGYLLNPMGNEVKDWLDRFWLSALHDYYVGDVGYSRGALYSGYPSLSKQSITTPSVMKRFETFNAGKARYDDKIKPFNFYLVGTAKAVYESERKTVQVLPMIPFTKSLKNVASSRFLDCRTGNQLKGKRYWTTLDEVYSGYFNHKESKFDGPTGHLKRKLTTIRKIVHIGKESSNLEIDYVLGGHNTIGGEMIQQYGDGSSTNNTPAFNLRKRSRLRKLIDIQFNEVQEWILTLTRINLTAYGISKKLLYRVKKSIKEGNVGKLRKNTKLKFINCHNKTVNMGIIGS